MFLLLSFQKYWEVDDLLQELNSFTGWTWTLKNMVVVVTTRVQKHEFRDQERNALNAFVQHICVWCANENLMKQWDAQ